MPGDESRRALESEPGVHLDDSRSHAWSSGFIGRIESRGRSGPFSPTATPDQKLVVVTKGAMQLEVLDGRVWRSALRPTASIGLTPGDHTDRLQWTAVGDDEVFETAHIFLPQGLVDRVTDEFRRPGSSMRRGTMNALVIDDAVISRLAFALVAAHSEKETDLLAASIFHALVARLLTLRNPWLGDVARRSPGSLAGARLERVEEFLRANCTNRISLERLANEAGLSKFHFARLFKSATGTSPHQYLINLRIEMATTLLSETERTVSDIAETCCFSSVANFSNAFSRRYSTTPRQYRNRHSR